MLVECYISIKGVKNKHVLSKYKYFFSKNKLPHTCKDSVISDKRSCKKQ